MNDIVVLLVDDEEAFVNTLAERLNMRGIKAESVYSGEQALAYIDNSRPDVMILDLKMPGIGGIETLRRVKKSYPDIQVIVLTGHGTDKHENEVLRLGAFGYLQKPVEIEILVNRIRDAYAEKIVPGR